MGMRKLARSCLLLCVTLSPVAWAADMAISGTQALAFGKFAAGSGGSVTVSPGGGRSASGDVVLVPSDAGTAASFSVTGDASASYAISLPANGMVVLASGAHTMAVNNFASSPSLTGTLGAGGGQTMRVGATLSVTSSQPPGSYSGAFDVTVNYN